MKTRPPKRKPHSIVAIIPLYNGAPYIEQAIRSVLTQIHPVDEFIVVDDGSTDGGPDIVRQLMKSNPSIRLERKENGGQASARNLGVRLSKSSLIALLDQDDVWYPDHVEELMKPFEHAAKRPLGWTYSNLDEIDERGGLVSRMFLSTIPTEHPKLHLASCLQGDMFILPSASMICRQAFEAVGGFDERLSGYEDDDLFLRLFRAGYENRYLNHPLSKWRIYPTSTSYSPRMAKSRMIFAKKLFEEFPNDPKRNRYYPRDLIAPRFYQNLMGEYRNSLRMKNKPALKRAIEDLKTVVPYLAERRRKVVTALLPLMSNYEFSRAAYLVRARLHFAVARLDIF